MSKTVLVIGKSGQVASALGRAGTKPGMRVVCAGRPETDVTDEASIERAIAAHAPAIVINAAAYTAVDKAESEPEIAHAVNVEGSRHLAECCRRHGLPLIHISTDYVFDGTSKAPYGESDAVSPVSVYGRTKADGEEAIREALEQHVIVRVSWIFSETGNNFVKTMLRLGTERENLSIVADQHGAPVFADDIAAALLDIAGFLLSGAGGHFGTYHFQSRPTTTWFGFAEAIFDAAQERGLCRKPRLAPIETSQYPTPAARPANSVLDTAKIQRDFGISIPDWRQSLETCLDRLETNHHA